jgi:hypothetical protein
MNHRARDKRPRFSDDGQLERDLVRDAGGGRLIAARMSRTGRTVVTAAAALVAQAQAPRGRESAPSSCRTAHARPIRIRGTAVTITASTGC